MAQRTLLLAGNWKMHHDHLEAISTVQKLAWALRDARLPAGSCEVAVIPPFTDLRSVQTLVQGDKLDLAYGAQDLSAHDEGAYTGEVSGRFLARLGCAYALVGHSERRAHHGEDDAQVRAKLEAALRHELVPILCVGESAEVREAGGHLDYVTGQLRAALEGIAAEALGGLVVAYEPVWAIGTGATATAQDAAEMATALRAALRETAGDAVADAARILYGGSVKAENVAEIVAAEDIDGALVGGASLEADGFAALCAAAVRG
ncbi:triose-phosphate isomerase [Brevibacterium sp. 5221]|uniref:Triosephosphate isomerase n=1 Tax=Brevibacterium rongguiense TaxID=2695267 RepID=A0A6N9H556_9MICO|nr:MULTISPECIES: triose-phosphate isomerase [Brevibacterium]MYM19170.1 triose-phosphate isomerase [Brevibacterium rongguiense]WAL40848.1 triose-phosphate isomerase [Brevibacterium sp. BRM-1]